MRHILIFVLMLLAIQAFGQSADGVAYHPEQKLNWSDFLGSPDYSDSTKAAQISTTIQLHSGKVNFWTGKAKFVGTAIMYKGKSWVKPGFRNDYVLSHEQIHFDIAYIVAKKLEADINALNVHVLNKGLVDAMYKNWHAIFLLNEQTYDLMTDGGNNVKMQEYYKKKVAGELKALEQNIF